MHRLSRAALLCLLAVGLALSIVPLASQPVDAATTKVTANCQLNLRARPTTASAIRKVIPIDAVVTVNGTVSGGAWSTTCAGRVHGATWYVVSAIDGRSVRSLLGTATVYAAAGLFRSTASGVTEGVDVSNWQGVINFARVRAAGKRFVIAKASEGSTWTDRSYARNKANAIAAGLRFGAYHFARPGSAPGDAVAEADHFIAVMGLRHGMLRPAVDLEDSGGLSVTALQAWARAFLGRIYSRLGVRAMIYTSASFWATHMASTTWFAANGYTVLWISHWKVPAPAMPAAVWGGRGWTFWQYSSCGSVPGIAGCVDLDRFRGSDLSRLVY